MAVIKQFFGIAAIVLSSSIPSAIAYDYAEPEEEPLTAVADLRFGVALYHYYQDQHLDALSELLVAEKKGGIRGHGDNPDLMKGGFYLAYGMERTASEIFAELLEGNRPLATRDAAWLYMARLRYLRGDYESAAAALDKISPEAAAKVLEEEHLLRLNSALRTGDLTRAEALLSERDFKKSRWWPYVQFNMGAAYARAEQYPRAADYFSGLLALRDFSDENLALYDRALTGAGYAHLLNRNYRQAIKAFSEVRLDSPVSNRALLGYGWSAVELQDFSTALTPWRVLASRSVIDENTQEVLVALPFAYEKMGLKARALRHFQAAETSFVSEVARLQEVIDQMEGRSLRAAMNIQSSTDINWLDYAEANQLTPELSYLVELFSKDEFLGLLQEWRDLLAIQENFSLWQEKLALYLEMLDERDVNRERELAFLEEERIVEKLLPLRHQRDLYAMRIAEAEMGTDFLNLLDPEDSDRYERIRRSESNLAVLLRAAQAGHAVMPMDELLELQEDLRRQKGLLLWRSAEHFDERIARARYQLAQANVALNSVRDTYSRVKDIAEVGQDLQPYRDKIGVAQTVLGEKASEVELAIMAAEERVRGRVMGVLAQQQERLQYYLANTRLAIARMLDSQLRETLDADEPAAAEESGP